MKRVLSFLMAVLLVMSLPMTAMASNIFDLTQGNVNVNADANGQVTNQAATNQTYTGNDVVITGNNGTTGNRVEITVAQGSEANVTIQDVTINTSQSAVTVTGGGDANITLGDVSITSNQAAMNAAGTGSVTVELDGTNSLTSGNDGPGYAGLNASNGSDITIQDENGVAGSLTAQGGLSSAGIGSNGSSNECGDITINSGTVTANGGFHGAGIGSGSGGTSGDITINGGNVTATGGGMGAGIGTGVGGNSGDISITGGEVSATGGDLYGMLGGAGIGNGNLGNMHDEIKVEISGDATVTATGTHGSDDIGGTKNFAGYNSGAVTVDTSKLTAEGSVNGVAGTYVPPQPSAPSAPPVYVGVVEEAVTTPAAPAKKNRETFEESGYSKGALWSDGYIQRTLFKVEDETGMKAEWEEALVETQLTVVATEENEAITFTTWVNGLKELAKLGVKTLVIKTADGEIELTIEELIALNGTEYILTQQGDKLVLMVDGEIVEF